MEMLVVNFLALVGLTVSQDIFSYEGYKVYQIAPKSVEEVDLLSAFEDDERFDFWSKHRVADVPVDVLVSPSGQSVFDSFLNAYKLNYEVTVENFEEEIQAERQQRYSARVGEGNVTFEEYMRHDEINAYLRRLAQDYPEVVTLERIGGSFEGRDILLVRIANGTNATRPIIFADAGIHAREWIAPSVALYIVNQLVENSTNSYLYQNVEWAIIPVANPDGYEFTHTSTRMWRKTRSPGTICFGADPNRNFGYRWGESGSSTWQCTEIFGGRHAFSEVETQVMRDYLTTYRNNIRLYVAIHSFGNWVLYPWSYANQVPDNAAQLQTVGELFHEAVFAAGGGNYTVGNSAQLLGDTAGCSDDYARGALDIPLSYTLELPGEGSGFLLPPSRIQDVVQQVWEGWKAWHQYVENTYPVV